MVGGELWAGSVHALDRACRGVGTLDQALPVGVRVVGPCLECRLVAVLLEELLQELEGLGVSLVVLPEPVGAPLGLGLLQCGDQAPVEVSLHVLRLLPPVGESVVDLLAAGLQGHDVLSGTPEEEQTRVQLVPADLASLEEVGEDGEREEHRVFGTHVCALVLHDGRGRLDDFPRGLPHGHL